MKMHIVNRLSRYPVIESIPKSARTSKSAAVLIILKDLEKEPSLILTKRAANLRHHAGQVAFPGGMWESGDKSLENIPDGNISFLIDNYCFETANIEGAMVKKVSVSKLPNPSKKP